VRLPRAIWLRFPELTLFYLSAQIYNVRQGKWSALAPIWHCVLVIWVKLDIEKEKAVKVIRLERRLDRPKNSSRSAVTINTSRIICLAHHLDVFACLRKAALFIFLITRRKWAIDIIRHFWHPQRPMELKIASLWSPWLAEELNFCNLTVSAVLWRNAASARPSFGA
jgi:hypothetical protein